MLLKAAYKFLDVTKSFGSSAFRALRKTNAELGPKKVLWNEINDVREYQRKKLYEKLLGLQGEEIQPQDYRIFGKITKPVDLEETRHILKYESEEAQEKANIARREKKIAKLMPIADAVKILNLKEASYEAIDERFSLLAASNSFKGGSKYVYDKIYHAKIVCEQALKRGVLENYLK